MGGWVSELVQVEGEMSMHGGTFTFVNKFKAQKKIC